jgi:kinesin family member C1
MKFKMVESIEKYEDLDKGMSLDITRLLDELKEANNDYQQIIGSIRVNVRVRPFISNDRLEDKKSSIIECESRNDLILKIPTEMLKSDNHQQEYHFSFERIYPPTSTQDNLFTELSSLIQSSIDGHNVCIFSYGQTGAGKTYTMLGGESQDSLGLLPRTVDMLFQRARELEQVGVKCSFGVCFSEIYNNKMINLLDEKKGELSELVSRKVYVIQKTSLTRNL